MLLRHRADRAETLTTRDFYPRVLRPGHSDRAAMPRVLPDAVDDLPPLPADHNARIAVDRAGPALTEAVAQGHRPTIERMQGWLDSALACEKRVRTSRAGTPD